MAPLWDTLAVVDGPALTGERTLPGIPEENYWFRRHVAAYRLAARMARGRILDAGSGEGYGTAILTRRGSVVGLDRDEDAVTHAARRYRPIRLIRGDLARLPVAPRSVDTLVALQVIEHLEDDASFLEAAGEILRPGGRVILSTPNRATFPTGLNPFHVRELDPPELRSLLASRFRSVRILGIEHRAPLALLDRFLGEPVQQRLVRVPWERQPGWLRAVLGTVTSRDFRVSVRADTALDLVGICQS
jgi:SAM-dependent methyltransferase